MVFRRLFLVVLAISAFLREVDALVCFECDSSLCKEPYMEPSSQLTKCYPYLVEWAGGLPTHPTPSDSAPYSNGSGAAEARGAAILDDEDQYVCLKAVFTPWYGNGASYSLRRCAPKNSDYNPCDRLQNQANTFQAELNFCRVCSKDYCNGGRRHSANSIGFILLLSCGLLFRS